MEDIQQATPGSSSIGKLTKGGVFTEDVLAPQKQRLESRVEQHVRHAMPWLRYANHAIPSYHNPS
jgi:hypothetical protein